jgi:intracellular septation protein
MKLLYDFFPILLFFIAYKLYGLYAATAVAIGASLLQVGFFWLKHRRFERMHLISLALIIVLGGLTLFSRDATFIKWKPTLVNWLFAVVFAASHFIGAKPLVARMLSQQIELPDSVWVRLNLSWIAFFLLAGAANLYVAFYYRPELDEAVREALWVNFKLFGLLGMTLLFVVAQAFYLARHLPHESGGKS